MQCWYDYRAETSDKWIGPLALDLQPRDPKGEVQREQHQRLFQGDLPRLD
jgi:hypothetical protein